MNITEKGTWPWAAYGQTYGCLHRQWIGWLWPYGWDLLASAITSVGAGHAWEGNVDWSKLNISASTPITGEQTLPLTRLWQPWSNEEGLVNIQCRLWTPQHIKVKWQASNKHRVVGVGTYSTQSCCKILSKISSFQQKITRHTGFGNIWLRKKSKHHKL